MPMTLDEICSKVVGDLVILNRKRGGYPSGTLMKITDVRLAKIDERDIRFFYVKPLDNEGNVIDKEIVLYHSDLRSGCSDLPPSSDEVFLSNLYGGAE